MFLCFGIIDFLLYIVSRFFVVFLVLCYLSLVSFTGFYTEDEPNVQPSDSGSGRYFHLLASTFQGYLLANSKR